MEIQTLPYIQPEPGLTANSPPQSLKDHYLAFIAHYNAFVDSSEEMRAPFAYTARDLTTDAPLLEVLLFTSQQEFLSDRDMDHIRMLVRIKLKDQEGTKLMGRQDQFKLIHSVMGWGPGGCHHKDGRWLRNPQVGKLERRERLLA